MSATEFLDTMALDAEDVARMSKGAPTKADAVTAAIKLSEKVQTEFREWQAAVNRTFLMIGVGMLFLTFAILTRMPT